MKEIDPDFRTKHGYPLLHVNLLVRPDGIITTVSKNTVKYDLRVYPARGCDFVYNDTSCSSKHVFEINKVESPIMFQKNTGYLISLYCLQENLDECIEEMRKKVNKQINTEVEELKAKLTHMQTLEAVSAKELVYEG
jgi:hypothetical protein